MREAGIGYKVTRRQKDSKGILLKLRVKDKNLGVLLTYHALDRMRLWRLSERQVLETLLYPEEVLVGHHGRYIAHRRSGKHIIRAIYEYQRKIPTLITVYRPLYRRYFEGEGRYEDKIFT